MSAEAIARLRAQFEAELTTNPSLYHPVDIDRVRTEDWQVKRYLLEEEEHGNNNEEVAFEALLKTLQWKKRFGLHERTDQYFPREFWELNVTEQWGADRAGHLIQWGRVRNTKIIPEISLLSKQFAAHCLERMDRLCGEKGSVFIGHMKQASFWTRDRDFEEFQMELMAHYPRQCRAMYIVDMPWIIAAILRLMMAFMPARMKRLLHVITAAQLPEVVHPELIPASMGGRRTGYHFPPGLVSIESIYKEMGLSREQLETIYRTYNLEELEGHEYEKSGTEDNNNDQVEKEKEEKVEVRAKVGLAKVD